VETCRGWRRRAGATGDAAAVSAVPLLDEENRRLRRENERLREERAICKRKKVLPCFAG